VKIRRQQNKGEGVQGGGRGCAHTPVTAPNYQDQAPEERGRLSCV